MGPAPRAQAALLTPGEDVDGLRSLLGEILTDVPAVARLAAVVAGTDVRYPVEDDAHPLAGYFASDRTVSSTDGPALRIAEAARSGRWILVDPTADGHLAAVTASLPDPPDVLRGKPSGDGPAAMLVRPDGYLAWASDDTEPTENEVETLRRSLSRWSRAVTTPA